MQTTLHVPARLASAVIAALLTDLSTTLEGLAHTAGKLASGEEGLAALEDGRLRRSELEALLEPLGFGFAVRGAIELVGERDLIETALLDALGEIPDALERATDDYRHGAGEISHIAAVHNTGRGFLRLLREIEAAAAVPMTGATS